MERSIRYIFLAILALMILLWYQNRERPGTTQRNLASAGVGRNAAAAMPADAGPAAKDAGAASAVSQQDGSADKQTMPDPLDGIVLDGLDVAESSREFDVRVCHEYRRESGRDALIGITRLTDSAEIGYAPTRDVSARVLYGLYEDSPDRGARSYHSRGWVFGLDIAMLCGIGLGGSWATREYSGEEFAPFSSGDVSLTSDMGGIGRLELVYKRQAEMRNLECMEQRIMSDSYLLLMSSSPGSRVGANLKVGKTWYSDINDDESALCTLSYAFIMQPGELRAAVSGEYRDTRRETVYVPDQDNSSLLTVHPYWTPANYVAGTASLEWRQELSPELVGESEPSFYGCKLAFGTDSDGNPLVLAEGSWQVDLGDNAVLSIKGMTQHSREWDEESVSAQVRCYF